MAENPIFRHSRAADPHTVYQLKSAKGVALGYASLGADGKVPSAQLPTGLSGPTNTDDLPEGVANLYYTADRADARAALAVVAHEAASNPHPQYTLLTALSAILTSYVQHCELASPPSNTDALPEGSTNLYFTDLRAQLALSPILSSYVQHCELSTFEPLGSAVAAVEAHEAAGNPHPQYVTMEVALATFAQHCEVPSQPMSTDELAEGASNLYFTALRASNAALANAFMLMGA